MVDRSIGWEKAVHLKFLVYFHPLGYQYLECIVDILKVHRLPFGRGISICVNSIPSFMATCKHCSYARKIWERSLPALLPSWDINRRLTQNPIRTGAKSSIHTILHCEFEEILL